MEKQIHLNDLLGLSKQELSNTKIKFNQWNGHEDPIELFQKNPDEINTKWFFWRTKQRYFKVGQDAICLLKLSQDTWLLTTMKHITKELNVQNGINYEGEELDEYQQYYGRVIVRYRKSHQTQCVFASSVVDKMEVVQILPSVYDGEDFPGYDRVRLSYTQLQTIIKRWKRDWVAALEHQKAVYLITDTLTGKLYVGSARSDNGMLLQRWRNYIDNGHGGNDGLRELVSEKGKDYVKQHFQYSILENYNARTDDSEILHRESWWKDVLRSREFGYNKN